jgi:hypothetical protein
MSFDAIQCCVSVWNFIVVKLSLEFRCKSTLVLAWIPLTPSPLASVDVYIICVSAFCLAFVTPMFVTLSGSPTSHAHHRSLASSSTSFARMPLPPASGSSCHGSPSCSSCSLVCGLELFLLPSLTLESTAGASALTSASPRTLCNNPRSCQFSFFFFLSLAAANTGPQSVRIRYLYVLLPKCS